MPCLLFVLLPPLPCPLPCRPSAPPPPPHLTRPCGSGVTNSVFRCSPPPQRWTGPGHHGPPGRPVAPTVATTARGRARPRRLCTGVVIAPATTSPLPTAPAACVVVSMTPPTLLFLPLLVLLAVAIGLRRCQSACRVSVIPSKCQLAMRNFRKLLRMPTSQSWS